MPGLVQRFVAVLVAANLALWPPAEAGTDKAPISGAMINFVLAEDRPGAPEIKFFDAAGKPRTLADFKGKLVLLNFWATWCAPCRREMADLDDLEGQLGGEKFTVVALSSDRLGFKVIENFYAQESLRNLAQYNDKTIKAQRAFRVLGLPTTFLIDPKGRIIGKLTGPAEWAAPEALALIKYYLD